MGLLVTLLCLRAASTKRCKDAGIFDSCTIGNPEDAAARPVIAVRRCGGRYLGAH